MLTHADLSTTQLYLDLVYDDLKEDIDQNNPLENLKTDSKISMQKFPGGIFSKVFLLCVVNFLSHIMERIYLKW